MVLVRKIRIYEYKNCGTCKRALRFLDTNQINYEKISIVDKPPTKTELRRTLAITDSITLTTSGWLGLAIWPRDPDKSLGPITTLVNPGTSKISSKLFTASAVSICTTVMMFWLAFLQ